MATPEEDQIRSYLHQLGDLALQKKEIEQKSARIERVVRALIDLLPNEGEQLDFLEMLDEIARPAGLTNAVRTALLKAGDDGLTPREVRPEVAMFLVGHSNPLASVHTVLKRLARTEDFETITKNGEVAYRSTNKVKQRAAKAWARRIGKPTR